MTDVTSRRRAIANRLLGQCDEQKHPSDYSQGHDDALRHAADSLERGDFDDLLSPPTEPRRWSALELPEWMAAWACRHGPGNAMRLAALREAIERLERAEVPTMSEEVRGALLSMADDMDWEAKTVSQEHYAPIAAELRRLAERGR